MQINDMKALEKNYQKNGTNNKTAANIGFALWGLTSFVEAFVQGSIFVLRMNISAENPPQRKAENR